MAPRTLIPAALLVSFACSETKSVVAPPVPATDGGTTTTDAGDTTPDAGEAITDAGDAANCEAAGPVVVNVPTDDGLILEGDLYTTGTAGAPAVVLLHMIPPSNTRRNYPANFIDALVQKGFNVLNLDRRGAGGDAALARTAYTGPDGKLDPKGAIDFMVAHDCAVDATRIAIVGASNGTTSTVDYTVYAAAENNVVRPKVLVFLTGGGYTETQNRVADHRATLDPLPIAFVFSTAERAWSANFEAGAPTTWQFMEYAQGAHGTRMFGSVPRSVDEVATFIESNL